MSPESPISPDWISGQGRERESRKSSISLDTGLWTTPNPRPPEPVKIILGESATKALLEAGECFLIVGKGSWPDSPGRMVIHCLPIPKEQADAACHVAMGSHRAVKVREKKEAGE